MKIASSIAFARLNEATKEMITGCISSGDRDSLFKAKTILKVAAVAFVAIALIGAVVALAP